MIKCRYCRCEISTAKKNIGLARRNYDDEGKMVEEFVCKECNRKSRESDGNYHG